MNEPSATETLPGARKVARVMVSAAFCIGSVLAILGGLALYQGWTSRRAAAERTVFPLRLQAGETVRGLFQTSARLPLEIWLVLQRHQGVADEAIDAGLLGTNTAPDLRWEVQRNGVTLVAGDLRSTRPSHFGAQDSRGRLLGSFMPRASGQYNFMATIASSHPDLLKVQPGIQIRPSLAAMKNAGARAAAGMVIGPILGFVGVLLLVLAGREWSQIRRVGAGIHPRS